MENFRGEQQYIAEAGDFLNGVDHEANEKLNKEIADLRSEGCRVKIGEKTDPAYNNPDGIKDTYNYLKRGDAKLKEIRKNFIHKNLATAAIANVLDKTPFVKMGKWGKKIDLYLEFFRDKLLYGENQTASKPWHNQRGSALTFLTISEAYRLRVSRKKGEILSEGKYPTMSGPLDESVFDEKINGLPLTEVMIQDKINNGVDKAIAIEEVEKRLSDVREFIQAPVTEKFSNVIRHCADSLGIRERVETVNGLSIDHLKKVAEKENRSIDDMLVMSFGCGTGLATLKMLKKLKDETGEAPTVILLDQDPLSLAAAQSLAKKWNLEDKIEVHCERLFSKLGKPLSLEGVLGDRKLDIAEDSGLREYLPDGVYKQLTRESLKFLRTGGLMITGNMNVNRPQKEFLHGLMGWVPKVRMRSIKEGFKLLQKSGIPKESIEATVTASGVYTVFAIET
jgi:hypothetical protein